MEIKKQLNKIKENWLIVVLVLGLLLVMSGGNNIITSNLGGVYSDNFYQEKSMMAESASYRGGAMRVQDSDFAPEVEERKITKNAGLTTEVKRGTFKQEETRFKNIVAVSGSFLLNENSNKYGIGRRAYYRGSYQIKVDTTKYNALITQLKEIGEVQSFYENMQDVTGSYTNLEIELEVEKTRLARYQSMYLEAEDVMDKVEINDKIFFQERRVKYLEDSLKRIDQRVDYSTISFTLNEKRSEYANIAFVKCSELIKSFVGSFNSLISLIFAVIPWLVAFLFVGFVWKRVRSKKKR